MDEKYLMNTIEQTYQRAKDENLGVSRNFIRDSAINGTLPSVRCDKKCLINWNQFLVFLGEPKPKKVKVLQTGQIRPVPEKLRRPVIEKLRRRA